MWEAQQNLAISKDLEVFNLEILVGINIEIWIWAEKHSRGVRSDWIAEKQLNQHVQTDG